MADSKRLLTPALEQSGAPTVEDTRDAQTLVAEMVQPKAECREALHRELGEVLLQPEIVFCWITEPRASLPPFMEPLEDRDQPIQDCDSLESGVCHVLAPTSVLKLDCQGQRLSIGLCGQCPVESNLVEKLRSMANGLNNGFPDAPPSRLFFTDRILVINGFIAWKTEDKWQLVKFEVRPPCSREVKVTLGCPPHTRDVYGVTPLAPLSFDKLSGCVLKEEAERARAFDRWYWRGGSVRGV